MSTPQQFIIATLNDGKIHPIFRDTIVYLGKTASVGLKVPFYIAINYEADKITIEDDAPLWLMGSDNLDELTLSKTTTDITKSDGKSFIPLCFHTDIEGEYICKVTIDSWEFKLGIEAVGENEIFKINLLNKGVEIPNGISRALYSTNIEQFNPDFAILNKKWKELLINYMDIMGGKGNSKQLIDALSWFGYGNKIELREVWKVNTLDGVKLFDREFTPIVDDEVVELIKNASKTTYLTIRHIPDAKHDEEPEQNFITRFDTPWDWSKEIMRSKMCLLGNFYETFFLPVHMNVLHSVVEDIYRGWLNDIKVTTTTLQENVYINYKNIRLESNYTERETKTGYIIHLKTKIPVENSEVELKIFYNDKYLTKTINTTDGTIETEIDVKDSKVYNIAIEIKIDDITYIGSTRVTTKQISKPEYGFFTYTFNIDKFKNEMPVFVSEEPIHGSHEIHRLYIEFEHDDIGEYSGIKELRTTVNGTPYWLYEDDYKLYIITPPNLDPLSYMMQDIIYDIIGESDAHISEVESQLIDSVYDVERIKNHQPVNIDLSDLFINSLEKYDIGAIKYTFKDVTDSVIVQGKTNNQYIHSPNDPGQFYLDLERPDYPNLNIYSIKLPKLLV
nr:MAG TPA: hypothetical protein [Caudoviricetes sp.]